MMLRRGGVYILYLNLVRSLSPLTRPERACGVVHLSSDHMSDANVSYDPPFFLNYHLREIKFGALLEHLPVDPGSKKSWFATGMFRSNNHTSITLFKYV